ncbi:polysaccharide deacetylase family protein [Oceanobacillus jeddahense]|uniref:polysaccharide deacetylase family protein n=1 Tax=Oceanobacillus jeddahense TaxID=1462527 RepID=UPI0005960BD7|nr:polysaccharide deacetylase family protein [Oceanobacillus jeddahense]
MKRYFKYVHVLVFLILIFTVFDIRYNPFQTDPVVMEPSEIEVSAPNDALYMEIEQKKDAYQEDPENAYIDEVWKKTPGRNGLEVNVEESYQKMKEANKWDEDLLVFNETSPDILLEDLEPSPIYRGNPEKEMVSFLINVSWGEAYIPEMLQILKDNQVKASFFIEGKWAQNNSSLVKMIEEEGHVIGNHAYDHPDMAALDKSNAYTQIEETNQILKTITGEQPKWFAPPSGSYKDETVETAAELEMETILWTVDTIDWKNPSVSVMVNRIENNVHPGAMILMHPTEASTKALEQMINIIKEKDYKIGTVESLLSESR